MNDMPLEVQFEHTAFCQQVDSMSPEQRADILKYLHKSFLGQRQFIKESLAQKAGIK